MNRADVLIVGGGVVGLSLASELTKCFEEVIVLERNYCYRESSYAAGGMLAPVTEVEFDEGELLNFSQQCLGMYPEYVRELKNETGIDPGLQSNGTIMTGTNPIHRKDVRRMYRYQKRMGLNVKWLEKDELHALAPGVRDELEWGLYASDEKSINNRLLGLALLRRCWNRGVQVRTNQPVEEIHYATDGFVDGVSTKGNRVSADKVILTAGAWTGSLKGLKPPDQLPVRPVKGQALSLQPGEHFPPDQIVRTPDFYGIPHPGERFLVGATMEEKGFESGNTAGAVIDLLSSVKEVLPHAASRPLLETWYGFRPATPDSKPIIGPSVCTPNLYFATGHYRKGILQAPLTSKLMRKHLEDDVLPEELVPFLPERFQDDSKDTRRPMRPTETRSR